jgi:hypothetical protein
VSPHFKNKNRGYTIEEKRIQKGQYLHYDSYYRWHDKNHCWGHHGGKRLNIQNWSCRMPPWHWTSTIHPLYPDLTFQEAGYAWIAFASCKTILGWKSQDLDLDLVISSCPGHHGLWRIPIFPLFAVHCSDRRPRRSRTFRMAGIGEDNRKCNLNRYRWFGVVLFKARVFGRLPKFFF